MAYHALMTVFLAFAVVTILRDIFENREIGFDHLLGAFSGFLLAGIAWGNLYLLIEVATPGAFTIGSGPRQAQLQPGTIAAIYFQLLQLHDAHHPGLMATSRR